MKSKKYECENCRRKYNTEEEARMCYCDEFEEADNGEWGEQ